MADNSNKRRAGQKLYFGGTDKTAIFKAEEESKNHLSKQVEDPFTGLYDSGGADTLLPIVPNYLPENLSRLPVHSNVLNQCISAMVTNIGGFGHQLEYIGEEDKKDSAESLSEKATIEGMLDYVNDEDDIHTLKTKILTDLETFGYAYLEITVDTNYQATAAYHVPANTMRKTKHEEEEADYTYTARRGNQVVDVRSKKRFRRYVQEHSGNLTYFAEWGDRRPIDPSDGKVNPELSFEDQASLVYCIEGYSAGETYALPRWINQLPAILGSRESEEVNLDFFRENTIPPMVVTVGGGSLSQESVDALAEQFDNNKGREGMHKVLVLEAIVDEEMFDMDGKPMTPRIEVKPMGGDRTSDALFQEYDQKNIDKIRSSFRLPPIFLGNSGDYTRATAEASIDMAESQVFSPERRKIDRIINNVLLGGRARYWRVRSNSVKMTGSQGIINMLGQLNGVGAMTPNIAIRIANEVLDQNMPEIKEPWGDLPYQKNSQTGENLQESKEGEGSTEGKENNPPKEGNEE